MTVSSVTAYWNSFVFYYIGTPWEGVPIFAYCRVFQISCTVANSPTLHASNWSHFCSIKDTAITIIPTDSAENDNECFNNNLGKCIMWVG